MNYETASVEEITAHFGTVSRQRQQQILKKFKLLCDDETVSKIQQAKAALKRLKYIKKNGLALEDRRKCSAIWAFLQKRVGKTDAYQDCVIEFQSYEDFQKWAITQIGFRDKSFEMDKDILFKGNRVYSPDTCVFVPQEVNGLFSGCYHAKKRGKYPIGVSLNKSIGRYVAQMSNRQNRGLDKYLGSFGTIEEAFACYKATKEARIKELAEKWKGQIDPRAYEALMARTVEWED